MMLSTSIFTVLMLAIIGPLHFLAHGRTVTTTVHQTTLITVTFKSSMASLTSASSASAERTTSTSTVLQTTLITVTCKSSTASLTSASSASAKRTTSASSPCTATPVPATPRTINHTCYTLNDKLPTWPQVTVPLNTALAASAFNYTCAQGPFTLGSGGAYELSTDEKNRTTYTALHPLVDNVVCHGGIWPETLTVEDCKSRFTDLENCTYGGLLDFQLPLARYRVSMYQVAYPQPKKATKISRGSPLSRSYWGL